MSETADRLREMRNTLARFTRRKYEGQQISQERIEEDIKGWETMDDDMVVTWFNKFFQAIEIQDPYRAGDYLTITDIKNGSAVRYENLSAFAINETSPHAIQIVPLYLDKTVAQTIQDRSSRLLWLPRSIVRYNTFGILDTSVEITGVRYPPPFSPAASKQIIVHLLSVPLWFINITLKEWINIHHLKYSTNDQYRN